MACGAVAVAWASADTCPSFAESKLEVAGSVISAKAKRTLIQQVGSFDHFQQDRFEGPGMGQSSRVGFLSSQNKNSRPKTVVEKKKINAIQAGK